MPDECDFDPLACLSNACVTIESAPAAKIIMTIGDRELMFAWDGCENVWRSDNVTLRKMPLGQFRVQEERAVAPT